MSKLEQLANAVALSPDNIPLRVLYIDALIEEKIYDKAESEMLSVLKQSPNDISHKIKLATIYFEADKSDYGVVMLEGFIDEDTDNFDLLVIYTKLLIKTGELEEAYGFYVKIFHMQPGFSDPYIDEELSDEIEKFKKENIVELEVVDAATDLIIDREKSSIAFKDVGGMQSIKDEIAMKVINPIKYKDLFKSYGKKIGGGILLYGPPGCGKTFIARATAGEIDSDFINVGLNNVLDLYLGQSEKNLHNIFESARERNPVVMFFDEIDALGSKRADMKGGAGQKVINQFLTEMDGVDDKNEGILIMGATNAPWFVDSAFKRPGRFDRIIFIPPPDVIARKEILEIKLKDKPVEKIDYNVLAKHTELFTGADLNYLVELSIEDKLQEIIKTGKETKLTTKFIKSRIKKIKPSATEWFETAKNYAIYSNQSGLYDDILNYLKIKK